MQFYPIIADIIQLFLHAELMQIFPLIKSNAFFPLPILQLYLQKQ